jgi:alpha-beta hydrolase superfamily lysophospholipase
MNSPVQAKSAGAIQKSEFGNIQPTGFPGLPENWVSDWETFPSSDQSVQLFQTIHRRKDLAPSASPVRALLIVHGLGEHGGRYLHAPHYLKDTVDVVYCLDQRGHGRSEGLRGHCDRFTQFTDDLMTAISRMHEELTHKYGKAEIHVLGHSLGGLVVLRTHFLNPTLPVKSVAVTSPLLGIKVKIPFLKRLAGNALSNIWGTLQLPNVVDPSVLSHDPAVKVAYVADRLVHNKVTPRFFSEMQMAIADTAQRDAGFAYPLQMQISAQDHIVDPEVSQKFFRNLKIRDKQLKVYPAFFHECLNEVDKEKTFEDLASWIKSHH